MAKYKNLEDYFRHQPEAVLMYTELQNGEKLSRQDMFKHFDPKYDAGVKLYSQYEDDQTRKNQVNRFIEDMEELVGIYWKKETNGKNTLYYIAPEKCGYDFFADYLKNEERDGITTKTIKDKAKNEYISQMTNDEYLFELWGYIANNNVIRLTYAPTNAAVKNPMSCVAHPITIKENRGIKYLIAKVEDDPWKEGIEIHRLDIRGIDRNSISVKTDMEYNPQASTNEFSDYDNIIGIRHPYKNHPQLEDVVLRVYNERKITYLAQNKIHPSQDTTMNFNGQYGEVTMKLRCNYELEDLIISLGTDIEVIKPAFLRKYITERIKRLCNIYHIE